MTNHNTPKTRTNLKDRLANAAGTVARVGLATVALGAATAASAEAAISPRTIASLESHTDQQIAAGVPGVSAYAGKLTIRQNVPGGVIDLHIPQPLIVYTNNPQGNTQNYHGLRDKNHVTYGYISRDSDKPHVVLFPYNHKTMHLTRDPNSPSPIINYIAFTPDGHGGFDWDSPNVNTDGQAHGGPLQNGLGQPIEIAKPSVTVVSGHPEVSL